MKTILLIITLGALAAFLALAAFNSDSDCAGKPGYPSNGDIMAWIPKD